MRMCFCVYLCMSVECMSITAKEPHSYFLVAFRSRLLNFPHSLRISRRLRLFQMILSVTLIFHFHYH